MVFIVLVSTGCNNGPNPGTSSMVICADTFSSLPNAVTVAAYPQTKCIGTPTSIVSYTEGCWNGGGPADSANVFSTSCSGGTASVATCFNCTSTAGCDTVDYKVNSCQGLMYASCGGVSVSTGSTTGIPNNGGSTTSSNSASSNTLHIASTESHRYRSQAFPFYIIDYCGASYCFVIHVYLTIYRMSNIHQRPTF